MKTLEEIRKQAEDGWKMYYPNGGKMSDSFWIGYLESAYKIAQKEITMFIKNLK